MTLKQKFISAYVVVAILFAIYASNFGPSQYESFAYNLGRGVVWPVVMFPTLGTIISGIIIVAFVAFITLFGDAKES